MARRGFHSCCALLGGLLLLASPGAAKPGDAGDTLRDRIELLNRELARSALFSSGPSQFAALLDTRARLLVELMAADPAQVAGLALPPEVAAQAQRSLSGPAVESAGEWSGTLEAAVADDFEHGRSRTYWYLRTGSARLQLHFAAPPGQRAGAAVRVKGLALAGHVAVSAMAAVPRPADSGTPLQCSTIGPQNIAVLMLTMPSFPSLPPGYTAATLQEAFFGSPSDTTSTASLNGMWKEMSYAKTSAVGQVFGPFALSQDYTCDQSSAIQTAAIAAADATVDFSQFTHIALVFPVSYCGSYGGLDSVGCWTVQSPSKGALNSSVGWFPASPGSSPPSALFTHELGHGLGLNHSSTDDYGSVTLGPLNSPGALVEYGDPFAIMGMPYNSTGYPAGQYTGEHKSLILDWLALGDYVEVTSAGAFTLMPYESMANPRALRVLRDPVSSAWVWLEYRQPVGDIDSNLRYLSGTNVYGGALVHYEDPALDSPLHTYLLDFTPQAVPNNFNNAALVAGSFWFDPYSPLTLSVSNATPSGLSVSVSYDTPCAALQLSSTAFSAAAGSGSIAVSAPSSCSWTASTGASWIHLTGVTSGQGNGTVPFAVDANSAAAQRNGYIAVGRQSTPIVQTGSNGISVLSVTPSFGSGDTGQFTFQVLDENGYADVTEVWAAFEGGTGCSVQVSNYNQILLTGAGGSIPLGAPGQTLSNSNCSVSSTGSSYTGSNNLLQVTVQMSFFAAFAGAHRITGQAQNVAGTGLAGGTVPVGTWVVPAVQQPAVTISANAVGAPFTLDGGTPYQAPVTFYFPAASQHTIQWLSSVPGVTNARYIFQNWSDSSTANPRTFTIPSSNVTYTGNLSAQYLLTTSVSPALAGSIGVQPTSADGFYNSGQVVTLTPLPNLGYTFWYFGGDLTGSTFPQTVTMSAPHNVTATFYCAYSFPGSLPSEIGPGPMSGMMIWTAGAGCQTGAISNAAWLTLGTQTVANGYNVIPFSIPANTGASQSATVTFSGNYTGTFQLTQDAAGAARPNVVSLSPNSGAAATQVFTLQAYHASGYTHLAQVDFVASGTDSLTCTVLTTTGGSGALWLISDSGTTLGPLTLPGTGTLQNNECIVSAATSSISGSGKTLTVNLGIAFQPAFAGSRALFGQAYDSGNSVWGPYVPLGTWSVFNAPALSVAKTADSSTAGAGSTIGFTIAVSNSSAAGTGTATAVTLNDPLPAGTGINWSVSPAYTGPGTCAVTGAAGSQTLACSFGDMAAGASTSVHVTSATSASVCATYSNTATASATNSGSAASSATITVVCPDLTIAKSHIAAFNQAQNGLTYTVTVSDASGAGPTSGQVTVTEAIPTGMTLVSMSGDSTWNCSAPPVCTTGTVLSGGSSYPPITVTVNVSSTAAAHLTNQVQVSGGGAANANASDLTTIAPFTCDLNADGVVNVSDVQLIINEALGVTPAVHDLNHDGVVNVADVQKVINAALGLGCPY